MIERLTKLENRLAYLEEKQLLDGRFLDYTIYLIINDLAHNMAKEHFEELLKTWDTSHNILKKKYEDSTTI